MKNYLTRWNLNLPNPNPKYGYLSWEIQPGSVWFLVIRLVLWAWWNTLLRLGGTSCGRHRITSGEENVVKKRDWIRNPSEQQGITWLTGKRWSWAVAGFLAVWLSFLFVRLTFVFCFFVGVSLCFLSFVIPFSDIWKNISTSKYNTTLW